MEIIIVSPCTANRFSYIRLRARVPCCPGLGVQSLVALTMQLPEPSRSTGLPDGGAQCLHF